MLRSKHFLKLIIASLLLAYVAIATVQYQQYRSVEAVMRRGDVNALWSFLQLNVEYERLDHALHQFVLDPESTSLEAVVLRYDLFLSRFSALESGSARTRGDLGFAAKSESCVKKLLSDNNLAAFYSVFCIGEDADVELPVQIRRLRETSIGPER